MKNTHLEHLEDNILNGGSQGGKEAVAFLRSLGDMLDQGMADTRVTVKWDGAPAIICGVNPDNGRFFVGTKSVFNKENPKICFFNEDIDTFYEGDLAEKLKASLKYFKELEIEGVVQGDLMFTSKDLRNETINGEKLYTFRPNTITYGIPVHHDLGTKASRAKIGVVFHTHYTGSDLPTMQAKAGADVKESNDVFIVKNDTPMHKVGMSRVEMNKFDQSIQKIERMCRESGDFLNELVDAQGKTGDAKFHISSFLKPFFNHICNTGTKYFGVY